MRPIQNWNLIKLSHDDTMGYFDQQPGSLWRRNSQSGCC